MKSEFINPETQHKQHAWDSCSSQLGGEPVSGLYHFKLWTRLIWLNTLLYRSWSQLTEGRISWKKDLNQSFLRHALSMWRGFFLKGGMSVQVWPPPPRSEMVQSPHPGILIMSTWRCVPFCSLGLASTFCAWEQTLLNLVRIASECIERVLCEYSSTKHVDKDFAGCET